MLYTMTTDSSGNTSSIVIVETASWVRAIEQHHEQPMTPVNGGYMLNVVTPEERRVSLFLYTRKQRFMIQGSRGAVEHYIAHDAAMVEVIATLVKVSIIVNFSSSRPPIVISHNIGFFTLDGGGINLRIIFIY